MSEYKFRAWVPEHKQMVYQGDPDIESIASFFFHYGGCDNLMLSTTKLDMNGKEIYAGDILKIEEQYSNFTVSFEIGAFYVNRMTPSGGKILMSDCPDTKTCEVIGNIYETK